MPSAISVKIGFSSLAVKTVFLLALSLSGLLITRDTSYSPSGMIIVSFGDACLISSSRLKSFASALGKLNEKNRIISKKAFSLIRFSPF